MDPLWVVTITGFFTVLSAAVSAAITKHGLPGLGKRTILHCEGTATELDCPGSAGGNAKVKSAITYEIKGGIIKIHGKKAVMESHVTIKEDGKTIASAQQRAKGPFFNGMAYLQYDAIDAGRGMAWKGVCLLRVPGFGCLDGYWLTEDTSEKGQIAFGTLRLTRV